MVGQVLRQPLSQRQLGCRAVPTPPCCHSSKAHVHRCDCTLRAPGGTCPPVAAASWQVGALVTVAAAAAAAGAKQAHTAACDSQKR